MRRILIFILLIGTANTTVGQKEFSYGLLGGLNLTKLSVGVDTISGTARPFLGIYGQYRPIKLLSAELNAAYSMRGERLDQKTLRFESNFIDIHALLRVHFLNAFSFSSGVGYYHALNARAINRESTQSVFERDFEDVESLSQVIVPLELGFQFQNEATLHFSYGIGLNGGFNNSAVTFRFPIRLTPKENRPPSRRAVAMSQIRTLDEGVLLVRLRTAQPLIDRLYANGASKQAEEVEREVEEENRKIIDAFKAYYDFSEVYFFYSSFSKDVTEGDHSSLMNSELESVSTADRDTAEFFIGEFDNLKPDTGRYYTGSVIDIDPDGGLRRAKRYGDYDIGANFQALVIKDRNFVQLRDPFPYYVRSLVNSLSPTPEALQRPIPIIAEDKHEKSYRIAVIIMNSKMKSFRERARTNEERKADKAKKKKRKED